MTRHERILRDAKGICFECSGTGKWKDAGIRCPDCFGTGFTGLTTDSIEATTPTEAAAKAAAADSSVTDRGVLTDAEIANSRPGWRLATTDADKAARQKVFDTLRDIDEQRSNEWRLPSLVADARRKKV